MTSQTNQPPAKAVQDLELALMRLMHLLIDFNRNLLNLPPLMANVQVSFEPPQNPLQHAPITSIAAQLIFERYEGVVQSLWLKLEENRMRMLLNSTTGLTFFSILEKKVLGFLMFATMSLLYAKLAGKEQMQRSITVEEIPGQWKMIWRFKLIPFDSSQLFDPILKLFYDRQKSGGPLPNPMQN